jgi:MGT family glycosyltransferase
MTPYPLDAADDESRPLPSRYVTWTAVYAEPVLRDVAAARPDVIVYDTFAMVGRLAGERLGVPHVNVANGHALDPAAIAARMWDDPRVQLSDACLRAADVLRERYGWADASPFAYFTAQSPHLNLLCEPPAYLTDDERAPFAPFAFWGSVAALDGAAPRPVQGPPRSAYVSVGTIAWRYWTSEALALLGTVAAALSRREIDTLVSLGGAALDDAQLEPLRHRGVRIERWVDQWAALAGTDVFVTHAGLNSTHEALAHGVPLVTAPFSADQPGMALRCAELGVAAPLTAHARTAPPVTGEDVDGALDALFADPAALTGALAVAHGRERAVIEQRPAVVERIMALA